MKILVMSDSHGAKDSVVKAVEKEMPDYILHLGDGERDSTEIRIKYPNIPIRGVKGNCDYYSALPETEGFMLNGKHILMTHGHIFYVKSTLTNLLKYAKKQKPDIILYGHTHIPYKEQQENLLIVNPGSIGFSVPKQYAVIEIIDGKVTCEHMSM